MKASELIKHLQIAVDEHGDHHVRTDSYDWIGYVEYVAEPEFSGPCFELHWSVDARNEAKRA